jgi:hypothetical protein
MIIRARSAKPARSDDTRAASKTVVSRLARKRARIHPQYTRVRVGVRRAPTGNCARSACAIGVAVASLACERARNQARAETALRRVGSQHQLGSSCCNNRPGHHRTPVATRTLYESGVEKFAASQQIVQRVVARLRGEGSIKPLLRETVRQVTTWGMAISMGADGASFGFALGGPVGAVVGGLVGRALGAIAGWISASWLADLF